MAAIPEVGPALVISVVELVLAADAWVDEPVPARDAAVLRLVEITDRQVGLPVFLAHHQGVMQIIGDVVFPQLVSLEDVDENVVMDPGDVDFELFTKEFRIVSAHDSVLRVMLESWFARES